MKAMSGIRCAVASLFRRDAGGHQVAPACDRSIRISVAVRRALGGCLLVLAASALSPWRASTHAQESAVPEWREQARSAGLSESAVERLGRIGLLITEQRGSPAYVYRRDGVPVFITSDTMIAAYTALLNAEFMRMELGNAELLRQALRLVWEKLGESSPEPDSESAAAARARKGARFMVATARTLLGERIPELAGPEKEEVEAERARVHAEQAAPGSSRLPCCRDVRIELDYRRCTPRGMYSRGKGLPEYFRAVAWLGLVPLKPDSDVELQTAIAIAEAVNAAGDARAKLQDLRAGIEAVIGTAYTADLLGLCAVLEDCERLREAESETQWLARVRVAVKGAYVPGATGANRSVVHLVAPIRTPYAELCDRVYAADIVPTGLHVAALLGSEFAEREAGSERERERLKSILGDRDALLSGSSLHAQLLRCLRLLVEDDARRPAFMRTPAWHAKSCCTVLTGWAWQMHLAALWAWRPSLGLPPDEKPAGFVEPNPVFFRNFHAVVGRAREVLDRSEAVTRSLVGSKGADPEWRRIVTAADKRARSCGLARSWTWLSDSLQRLAGIAAGEIEGSEISPEDQRFIAGFGAGLDNTIVAGMAFARREPLLNIVDVHFDPDRGTVFHVAVGPGRVMYVIMPWKGKEVLCRGLIWPYHEIEDRRILTDADWEERLRGKQGNRPALPAWLRKYAGERTDE